MARDFTVASPIGTLFSVATAKHTRGILHPILARCPSSQPASAFRRLLIHAVHQDLPRDARAARAFDVRRRAACRSPSR